MERPRIIAPWLRRGVEGGVFGGLLSFATLIAYHFSLSPRFALPQGLDGAMIVLPAILSLAVVSVGYPTFLAFTRSDAVLGSIAAFLVAADLLTVTNVLVGDTVFVHQLGKSLPLGLVASAWSVPVAVFALAFGQSTALGFGRSAAFRSVAVAVALAIIAALSAARFT